MGGQKFQNDFLFSSLTKFHDVCVLQIELLVYTISFWIVMVVGVTLFPRTGRPASSANNTHTQNRERKKSTQSSLPSWLLSIFFHHQSTRRETMMKKTKQKSNPKHKRLHLRSEHTQWATQLNGEMRKREKKRKTEMIHKLKRRRLDLSLFSFRLSFQFQFSSPWRCLSV